MRKTGKLEDLKQDQKRVTICQKRDTISQAKIHAFDIGQNVSRWQKRDTILETLILVVYYTTQKRVTIY